jgi:hypothetical protein
MMRMMVNAAVVRRWCDGEGEGKGKGDENEKLKVTRR